MWTSPELVAEDFVENYLSDENFPLDLKRISLSVEKKLNIEIYFHELEMPDEITAQLRKGKYAALIYINKLHSFHRQRFSVAHEFGHLILKHRDGIICPGTGESDWEYETANQFASALLMPSWQVSRIVNKNPDSLPFLVNKISKYFGVSMEAAARRFAAIDVLPGLITLVDPAAGRLEWEYHSPCIHLDQETFQEFLVRYFAKPYKRETDLNIMGYPFRVETKRLRDKYLLTCRFQGSDDGC